MPYQDNTGPFGTGPVGKGMGPCGENIDRRDAPRWGGRGIHQRRRIVMSNVSHPVSSEQEAALLEERQIWLQNRLDFVTHHLEELRKSNSG
jgi:hypothetical protein